jgi:hypothetical protein
MSGPSKAQTGLTLYEYHLRRMAADFAREFSWDEMDDFTDIFEDPALKVALMYRFAKAKCSALPPGSA